MAGEFAGKAKFIKIDLTDSPAAAAEKYEIDSIPATLIIKDAEESGRVIGIDAGQIEAELKKVI